MLSIKQRQLNLKYYGFYYVYNIDGIEGKQTKNAYKKFQEYHGLKADGIYGRDTEKMLLTRIRYIQHLLIFNDFYIFVDGLIGEKTINAIKEFQKANGILSDGIVGKETMKCLENSVLKNIKHFKYDDFKCSHCGKNIMNVFMIDLLEEIRNHYNKPLIPTCGFRCQEKNSKTKGSIPNSRHILGSACDFYVEGINTNELLKFCYELKLKGFIRYTYTNNTNMRGAVHIDFDE